MSLNTRRALARSFGWLLSDERRFFLTLTLVQALLTASLVLALSSPKTLDTLTSEKVVRGTTVEAPIDRASGLMLFVGAGLSAVAVATIRRRLGRWDGFWAGYGVFLLLAGLEESDWLKETGLSPRILGHRIGAFHDLVTKLIAPLRAGTSEYPLAAPLVVLVAGAVVAGLALILWRRFRGAYGLDLGLVFLLGLGILLGSLGVLIDADLLPKPVTIDWKAHLEEPLEAVGAVCLALVALEAAIRAGKLGTSPSA